MHVNPSRRSPAETGRRGRRAAWQWLPWVGWCGLVWPCFACQLPAQSEPADRSIMLPAASSLPKPTFAADRTPTASPIKPAQQLASGSAAPAQALPRTAVPSRPAPDSAPTPLQVPPELLAQSRIEPSGLLWLAELDRYLLLSDDTGTRETNNHAPWLFTCSVEGRLDAVPLRLEGLDQINDLEAVTRGPQGLYLLTSQSLNRQGKRPGHRQLLLRAELGAGRRLIVAERVRLFAAVRKAYKRHGADWLFRLLGADPTPGVDPLSLLNKLDIEGIAWAHGGLYLGLKEPLGRQGEALCWRLNQPEALFRTSRLEPDQLTRQQIPLQLTTAAGPVPLGIADIHVLPDGRWVIASTTPDAAPRIWGAVWLLEQPTPGTQHAPRLLRAFEGLKPEGVSLGPDGLLTLVFDQGEAAAGLWLRMAL